MEFEGLINKSVLDIIINQAVEQAVNEQLRQLLNKIDVLEAQLLLQSKQIMTLDEAADFMKNKPSTIRTLLRKKIIPYYKQGKRLYLKTSDVVDYLLKVRMSTQEEIDSKARAHIRKLNSKYNLRVKAS